MASKRTTLTALAAFGALSTCNAGEASLRGGEGVVPVNADGSQAETGVLSDTFILSKRFDLAASPSEEWDVEEHPDQNLTHSCANYIDDPSTVFSRDGSLVLKVASVCEGGGCLNSGRVMSKQSFKYGLFTFSAKVPKCNYIWPALWLLPEDQNGEGNYGRWPCSGEIDVLETVHDQEFGTFNLVAGYGSTGGCAAEGATTECNKCKPEYCTSTTMHWPNEDDRYFIQDTDCDAEHPSWDEHTWVMNWQPDELTTWIDPVLSYDAFGRLKSVHPKPESADSRYPSWRSYKRENTETWLAVEEYMSQCFAGQAQQDAPFDDGFKIVLNIAIGGYGGAPCVWGADTCQSTCGGAVGSELVINDISVWEKAM